MPSTSSLRIRVQDHKAVRGIGEPLLRVCTLRHDMCQRFFLWVYFCLLLVGQGKVTSEERFVTLEHSRAYGRRGEKI